jgi:uncharacterized protein (DUF2141 family)
MVLNWVSFSYADKTESYSLTVKIDALRNSEGMVRFALYNMDGSIPDMKYKKYYQIQDQPIYEGSSSAIFKGLPKGNYAVSALHDENSNGKIDKRFIMPLEGVGFTNYSSIGLTNRPNFSKASVELNSDMESNIKINYFQKEK